MTVWKKWPFWFFLTKESMSTASVLAVRLKLSIEGLNACTPDVHQSYKPKKNLPQPLHICIVLTSQMGIGILLHRAMKQTKKLK